jgi:hypothetical protein
MAPLLVLLMHFVSTYKMLQNSHTNVLPLATGQVKGPILSVLVLLYGYGT